MKSVEKRIEELEKLSPKGDREPEFIVFEGVNSGQEPMGSYRYLYQGGGHGTLESEEGESLEAFQGRMLAKYGAEAGGIIFGLPDGK